MIFSSLQRNTFPWETKVLYNLAHALLFIPLLLHSILHHVAVQASFQSRQCGLRILIPPLLHSILQLETASTILRVDNVDCAKPQSRGAHADFCSAPVSRPISGSLQCSSVHLECFFHPTLPSPRHCFLPWPTPYPLSPISV